MPKVKLNHTCNVPEHKGKDGDVVECTEEQAERLFSRGGATPWPPPERATVVQDEDQDDDEDAFEPDPDRDDEPAGGQVSETDPEDTGDVQGDDVIDEIPLSDMGITTKKQGREDLEKSGIHTLADYHDFTGNGGNLADLAGISKAKGAKLDALIADYKQLNDINTPGADDED